MTSVAEGAAAPSEFQHRGAFFRNVVIISALVGGTCLLVVGRYGSGKGTLFGLAGTGADKSDWMSLLDYPLVVLVVLAVVQVLPWRAWRWTGLVAYVFAGIGALGLFVGLWACFSMLFSEGFRKGFAPLSALISVPLVTLGYAAEVISWLYLGRYCRGWAREFAPAKAVEATGTDTAGSQQKETP